MARGGINKAVVQRARQALIARGEHPSIDAVRIEMGNTGSKTTIHRYLKELEAQHPSSPLSAVTLSEQLARLVEQLAGQLHDEAQEQISAAQAVFDEQSVQLQAQLQLAQQALAAAHQQMQIQASALAGESEKLASTLSTLQAEQLRGASLNQAVGELQVRLSERDEQIRSLEEKHRHARDALEHYRAASREQREQEQRRHEGQVQQLQVELRQLQQGMILRQDELTRLHRDNERLVGENRQAAAEQKVMSEQLEQRDAQVQGLRSILGQAQGASEEVRRQLDAQSLRLEQKQTLCGEQARQLLYLQSELESRSEALKAYRAQAGAAAKE